MIPLDTVVRTKILPPRPGVRTLEIIRRRVGDVLLRADQPAQALAL